MNILKIIVEVFNFIKKNITIIVFTAMVISFFLLLRQCETNKVLNEKIVDAQIRNSHNLRAYFDSIHVKLDKQGNKLSESLSYNFENLEDLKVLDPSLYERIMAKYGKALFAVESNLSVKLDSLGKSMLISRAITDSTFLLTFSHEYSDSGLNQLFKAETEVKASIEENRIKILTEPSKVIKNDISIDVFYSIVKRNDSTFVNAESKSKYVKFNNLDAVVVGPVFIKPKEQNSRFGFGFSTGIAWAPSGNDFLVFRPMVGLSLNYNIINFKKKK